MRVVALLALTGALALTACGRSEPEPQPVGNDVQINVEDVPVVEETPTVNQIEEPANTTVDLPPPAPPPHISEDQQMHDDADATGLTSRLPDDPEMTPGAGSNSAAPKR